MTRALVPILLALLLSGCFLDGAGRMRPDGATEIDASVPPLVDGGPRDAFVPQMDSGPRDAGQDAGFVEMVDAFVPDAGTDAGTDAGPPDAGTDAGPPPPACELLYPGRSACPALAGPGQCAFYFDAAGSSEDRCDNACGTVGDCAAAYNEGSSGNRCGVASTPDESCGTDYQDVVCVCDIL